MNNAPLLPPRVRWLAVPLLSIALLLAGCGSGGDDAPELGDPNLESSPREALATARALWSSNGAPSYDMRFNWLCFCIIEAVEERDIQVRDGVVAAGGLSPDFGNLADHETVQGLFDLIEEAIDRDAAKLDVTYHATLGYPMAASIDYNLQMADEELGFTVHELILR